MIVLSLNFAYQRGHNEALRTTGGLPIELDYQSKKTEYSKVEPPSKLQVNQILVEETSFFNETVFKETNYLITSDSSFS